MSLKKLAESFNYLSGIKDLSIMKGDLNEEINLTPEQDKELLNIILKYVKDSDDAEAIIQDYIDGATNRPDIQDGSFADEFEAWKKKHNIKEGTCGYSVDGKPADKPAGPHLLRKANRREIRDNFDDRLKSFMGADDFEKATNPKLSRLINNAITSIDPNMSYVDFAKGVAQVLRDEYNQMNQNDFIRVLRKELDI